MFNSSFYPTPIEIVAKMKEPYEDLGLFSKKWKILEPSAGKGDLARAFSNKSSWQRECTNVDCIEIEEDLKAILKEKGYTVVWDDFLSFVPVYSYDLIVMNPPFDTGVKHLLHAWDILRNGYICCLLNRETYFNPYTKERQLLRQIIDNNGTIEELGDCFSSAERRTNVNIILVRLVKKAEEIDLDIFKEETKEKKYSFDSEEIKENPIAVRDVIGNLVLSYEEVKQSYFTMWQMAKKIKSKANRVISRYNDFDKYFNDSLSNGTPEGAFNYFIEKFNQEAWENVFKMSGVEKLMTKKVSDEFSKFKKNHQVLSFTKDNVTNFIQNLFCNMGNIADGCIEEVFDLFTKYHEENRVYFEGWKTNQSWKVNKKVILPRYVTFEDYWGFKVNWNYQQELNDIDRAMCFVEGINFENIQTIIKALENKFTVMKQAKDFSHKTTESSFFEIRFFKKGTIHLIFKKQKLLDRFNYLIAKKRNWLPPSQTK